MLMTEYLVSLPFIYLVIAISVLLVYGAVPTETETKQNELGVLVGYKSLEDGKGKVSTIAWLGILSFAFTLWLSVGTEDLEYTGRFILDEYSRILRSVLIVAAGVILLLATDHVRKINKGKSLELSQTTASVTPYSYEMIILIQLAVLGLLLLVSAYDLLALYLSIELQSLSLYLLASLKRTSEYSTEAGLKYFVLGAISSGLLLFGSSLIYGISGSISFDALSKSTFYLESFTYLIGVLFIFSGLFFKLSIAPFHQWTPDVYEGSPTLITAFFAIVPKIAVLGLVLRLIFKVFYTIPDAVSSHCIALGALSFDSGFKSFLLFCSFLSLLCGTLGGLYQRKLKRLLAYSTIGHMGYILIGVLAGSIEGITAVFLYLFIYMITSVGIFSFLLAVSSSLPKQNSREHRRKLVYLSDLAYLSHANPVLAIAFSILIFSMAGIPPLAGFFSKLYLFLAALNSSLALYAIIAVLFSVIGCFYYIRLIKSLYFSAISTASYRPTWPHLGVPSFVHSFVIATSVCLLLFFICYPGPLLSLSLSLALTLLV